MPRRSIAIFTMTVLVTAAACTGSGVPSSPSASPTATGSASAPRPIPTATPTPSPTVAAEPLVVSWTRQEPRGLTSTQGMADLVARDGVLVLISEISTEESFTTGLWRSTDGLAWQLVAEQEPGQRVAALTVGGPGFVGVGTDGEDPAAWVSADGATWERVEDASLVDGYVEHLVSTDSGVIAFGGRGDAFSGGIWTSADGREWLAATNETGLQVANGLQTVADHDGRAVAFVKAAQDGPVEVWETTGRADWTRVGELPDSTASVVGSAAGGPRGWVAIGSADETGTPAAWASDDGRTWRSVGSGPDVSNLIADASGFIAVGFIGSVPGETCGDQRDFEMRTWTSADGAAWTLMPSGDFGLATVLQAVVLDRTLIGIGVDYGQGDVGSGEGVPAAWTAPLPEQAIPATTSDEPTTHQGCGP